MPSLRWPQALLLTAALAGFATHAQERPIEPIKLHGVSYAPSLQLQGQALQLNGAGTRYKAVFKVYTAGLYLEKPARSLQEIAALPGPKRISVTMLRDIDSAELGKLFSRGMEDNMERSAFSKLIPGVMRMSDIFTQHKKLLTGETFTVDWMPGQGTLVTVKGQAQGDAFKEPEFFNALLGIWLGPKPADQQLKKALLGEAG
ncbi:chalcone isomerase family protein [Comamonas resistens]|uniref:Chalcone isomerase family protein n=1 Tax=Comamonas resistens TaxID=3046670 RepID=A0ABY8SQC9_9BURK|nr:chalcone isomerase family protein [Comamonas resistens]MDL5035873.1 chalcone isomerase family protein [Comamonas resistens]WHS65278.1 chalcone isomerase family protein [Comamonas resistens]